MAAQPSHRTRHAPCGSWPLAHVFYEFGRRAARTVGHLFRAKHRIGGAATHGSRNSRAIPRAWAAPRRPHWPRICGLIQGDGRRSSSQAFKDFAFVLSLVPELKGWTGNQKRMLVETIRAKVSADEAGYLRLLQRHTALKEALVRLGSTTGSAAFGARTCFHFPQPMLAIMNKASSESSCRADAAVRCCSVLSH